MTAELCCGVRPNWSEFVTAAASRLMAMWESLSGSEMVLRGMRGFSIAVLCGLILFVLVGFSGVDQ